MADEFVPVALLDPAGVKYLSRDAVEFNNLVYGYGYRLADVEATSAPDVGRAVTTGRVGV